MQLRDGEERERAYRGIALSRSGDDETRERYITAGELARTMGVSISTIKRWTAAGMPSETWGMGHARRYLASEAINWAHGRADTITTNHIAA